ncbi:MAG: VanZ family protein [Clostridium sp.]|nr:VanZ family protein [Clostridium sp.]
MGIYLENIFIYRIGFLILLIAEVIRFVKAKKAKRKFFCLKEFFVVMFQVYLIALISITIFPLEIINLDYIEEMYGVKTIEEFKEMYITVNLLPLVNTIKDIIKDVTTENETWFFIKFWLTNLLGNIILLSPLAVLVPILSKKFRSLKSVVILCFCTSCFIEFLQYVSLFVGNSRSVDIDDVILNTLGAFIGFGIFKILSRFSFFNKSIED